MRDPLRLLIVVGEAAFFVVAGCSALVLIAATLLRASSVASGGQTVAGAAAVFLPTGLATWWISRKLQEHFSRREARAVAIAFVVFAPASLSIALFVPPLLGSAADLLFGSHFLFFAALLAVIVVMTVVWTFLACALVLWITRRIERAEQHNLPTPTSGEF